MQQFRKLKNALDCDTNGTRSVYQVGIPARMFVVASEREFYNKCISITVQQDRNFYEVIKETSLTTSGNPLIEGY